MLIERITIQNYRSVKNVDVYPKEFNVFAGQNNHGKTNFFDAVEWFFKGPRTGESEQDIRFSQIGSDEFFVEIEFSGAQDGARHMLNDTGKTKMLELLNGSDRIIVQRSSLDPKKRKIKITEDWITRLPTGFDSAFNDFLPFFEYIGTKKYFEDVGKFGKTTPVGLMLSNVLSTILEQSTQYQEFKAKFDELFHDDSSQVRVELDNLSHKVQIYLEKQFPDCTKVTFEVDPPVAEELLKNFETTVDDGVITTAAEKGDGMQRALMLSILQVYAEFRKSQESSGKNFIFFIDEAELHLHPSAQRKLKEALLTLTENEDQVFINTHSSVLIVDSHTKQKEFKVEKIQKVTHIDPITETEKSSIVFELLGGSPSDLLLPKNFLLVEGKSENELLTRVIERFYKDKNPIQIVYAEGGLGEEVKTMAAIGKLLSPIAPNSIYRDRLVLMIDKPNRQRQAEYQQFQSAYSYLFTKPQLFVLVNESLEEEYPVPWKKTSAEVASMNRESKILLAREVGEHISQQDFETQMNQVFLALARCWELSYS